VLWVVVFVYCHYSSMQYGIVVKKKTDVYICLMQPDSRLSWSTTYDVSIGYAVLRSEGVCHFCGVCCFLCVMCCCAIVVLLLFLLLLYCYFSVVLCCCVLLLAGCCCVVVCVVAWSVLLLFVDVDVCCIAWCCCCVVLLLLLIYWCCCVVVLLLLSAVVVVFIKVVTLSTLPANICHHFLLFAVQKCDGKHKSARSTLTICLVGMLQVPNYIHLMQRKTQSYWL